MRQFERDAGGFEKRPTIVDESGHITGEAAIPRSPIQNFSNGSDTSRCITCGVPSCTTGALINGDNRAEQAQKFDFTAPFKERSLPVLQETTGCPIDHDIPRIQKEMEQAQQIFNAAFEVLLKLDPEKTEELKTRDQNLDDPDLPDFRARLSAIVFKALADAGATDLSQKYAEKYNSHMKKAWNVSEQKGPMHDLFGRLCSDSLCKSTCQPGRSGHGSVEIPMNMTYLGDFAYESGWLTPIEVSEEQRQGKTILIVGTGFAGMTAADRLLHLGYDVVMVEKNSAPFEPGGQNILNYKILQNRFNRHLDRYRKSGVKIETNREVGTKGNLEIDLVKEFGASAVMYATGATIPHTLELEGSAVQDIQVWNQSLQQQQRFDNQNISDKNLNPTHNFKNKMVAIIGTSDTAVDVLHTAAAQGAKEVIFISRGDYVGAEDVSALQKALLTAQNLGVEFKVQENMSPTTCNNDDGKKVLSDGKVSITVDEVVFAVSSGTGMVQEIFNDSSLPMAKNGRFAPKEATNEDKAHQAINPNAKIGAGYLGQNEENIPRFSMGDNTRNPSLAAIASGDAIHAVKMLHTMLSVQEL